MIYSVNTYLELGEYAKNYDHSNTLNEIKEYFGFLYDKDEMNDLGLKLQITNKGPSGSKPMYLHGYVISSALHKYINDHRYSNLTILETGTARGFSDIVMAKMLENNNLQGKIHTLDIIPHNTPEFSNCLKAAQLKEKISREKCLEEWKNLCDKYIIFHVGDSNKILEKLNLERIHFAFLDGHHDYNYVKNELNYVRDKQKSGDIIVCDDYTKTQCPEICKAVDEFLSQKLYDYKIFYGDDGTKKRGYVYMVKI